MMPTRFFHLVHGLIYRYLPFFHHLLSELTSFKIYAKAGGTTRMLIEHTQFLRINSIAVMACSTGGQLIVTGGLNLRFFFQVGMPENT